MEIQWLCLIQALSHRLSTSTEPATLPSYWMMPFDAAESISLNNSISMGTASRTL